MNTIHRLSAALAAVFAVASLAGCADADIAAMRARIAHIAPPAPVVPPELVAYEAWTQRETAMLDRLTVTIVGPAGHSWDYQPVDVVYQYRATPDAKQLTRAEFKPPARFMLDLPGDAVAARSAAVSDLVQQLAELTAARSAFEPSAVAVAAPNAVDRAWLRMQAEVGLAHIKGTGKAPIRVIDIAGPYRAGFIADVTSPVVRTVANVPSTHNQ